MADDDAGKLKSFYDHLDVCVNIPLWHSCHCGWCMMMVADAVLLHVFPLKAAAIILTRNFEQQLLATHHAYLSLQNHDVV